MKRWMGGGGGGGGEERRGSAAGPSIRPGHSPLLPRLLSLLQQNRVHTYTRARAHTHTHTHLVWSLLKGKGVVKG